MNVPAVLPRLVLMLSLGLLTTGCATLAGPPEGASVAFQSYDLPGTLDSNAVIQAVARAFTQALGTQPRVREGSVPPRLPAEPARFSVKQHSLRLPRLGVAWIPRVVCPQYMAVVEAVVADAGEGFTPHRYTGCIQAYAGRYSVQLVDGRMALEGRSSDRLPASSDALSRIGRSILEQVAGARLRERGRQPAASEDREQPTTPTATSLQAASGERPLSVTTTTDGPNSSVPSSPLVCLAPRHESATVRAQPGAGPVVAVLVADSLTAVAEPVDASYVRVETEQGVAGWVNRSDVRRLPCPIG